MGTIKRVGGRGTWVPSLIAVAICAALPAQAQEQVSLALADESAMFGDLPSVFSVSRYEETLADAPASITVVTRDMIRLFGYRNLAEVLAGISGFSVVNDLNYSYVGFRGFARSGDYNTRMLLLVDGLRLNDAIYDSASVGSEDQVDIDAIERIEVTRGPGSSVYGTNALMAVVNIITRQGKSVDGAEARVGTDSRGLKRASAVAGTRYENGVDAFISLATASRTGRNHITFENSGGYTPPESWRADYLDDERYDRALFKLAKDGYALSAGHSTRKKVIPTASFDTLYNEPGTSTEDTREWLSLSMSQRLTERSELRASFSYNEASYRGRYKHLDESTGEFYENLDDSRSRWWSGDVSWLWRGASHTFVAGVDRTDVLSAVQTNADTAVYLDEHHRSNSTGFYVQDTWKVASNWQLVSGARYDVHQGSKTRSALSPRLATVWTPTSADVLKLMYGQAYRVPNMYEQYYGDGGATQTGNPSLESEHVRTLELAWDHHFSRNVSVAAALYSYSLHNGIELTTDLDGGLMLFRNVESSQVKGASAEVTRTGEDGSFAQMGANFSQSESSNESEPKIAPALQLFGKVAVPVQALDANAALEWRRLSHRENARREAVAPYSVFNLLLSSSEIGRKWRWTAGVYNVFNKRYGDPSGREIRAVFVPQEGRLFALQFEYVM